MSPHNDEEVGDLVRSALAGDPDSIQELRKVTHEQLQCATESDHLVLRADAVIAMLRVLRTGAAAPKDVQAWASFMQRGYVDGQSSGGIRPIDIDYEAVAEDAIVEAIGRMDELGDLIDGEMTIEEIDALVADLERSTASR